MPQPDLAKTDSPDSISPHTTRVNRWDWLRGGFFLLGLALLPVLPSYCALGGADPLRWFGGMLVAQELLGEGALPATCSAGPGMVVLLVQLLTVAFTVAHLLTIVVGNYLIRWPDPPGSFSIEYFRFFLVTLVLMLIVGFAVWYAIDSFLNTEPAFSYIQEKTTAVSSHQISIPLASLATVLFVVIRAMQSELLGGFIHVVLFSLHCILLLYTLLRLFVPVDLFALLLALGFPQLREGANPLLPSQWEQWDKDLDSRWRWIR